MNKTMGAGEQPEYSILRNPAAVTLAIVGALAVIAGPIMWGIGARQLASDTWSGQYLHAVGLDNGVNIDTSSSPAMSADQTLIGFGIGVLILGVFLLVAFIVVAAVKRPAIVPAAQAKSYEELKAEKRSAGTYFE